MALEIRPRPWSARYPCQLFGTDSAPWLRTQVPTSLLGSKHDFPRLSSPSIGSLATSRCPRLFVSFVHLLSIRSGRVKSGRVLGLHATPVSFRPRQRPLVAIPGSCFSDPARSRLSLTFASFCLAASGRLADFTTPLSLVVDVVRPSCSGLHATPIPCGGTEPPDPLMCVRFPLRRLISESFGLSANDFP